MPERSVDFLLIGGGIASAQCAAELRRRGAEGSITIVGREPHPPYDRPPLSKEYLRGEQGQEEAEVHPRGWYEDNDVELITARSVMGLDPEARTAKLQGKETLAFDKALLATGAMVNILRLDGAELDGIHYLRTFGNSDAIRADIESAEHVLLVGGGYIGTEVAASLVEMGKRVTIVMPEQKVLSRVFGEQVGGLIQQRLQARGIEIVAGAQLEAFLGEERASGVLLESGREIDCDAIIVGAGARPDTMLAQRAGLEVDDGIVCDASLQTSAAGIYAAGDCCSYESARYGRLRVEHWDAALQQGRHAARAMLGDMTPFDVLPYFFSDLSDWAAIEYVGHAREWDEVVLRGDPASGPFSAWYLNGGELLATLTVDCGPELMVARRLIEARARFDDSSVLADLATELGGLAAGT